MHRAIHLAFGWALLAVWSCAVTVAQAQQADTRPESTDNRRRVLVLPLEPLSEDAEVLAQTVARSLVLDLSRVRNLHATGGEKVAPDDAAALEAGKAAGAAYVVWGTLQRVEGRIRITGQVLDVERNEPAGPLKLTGSFRELFELQDLLVEQVRRRMDSGPQDEPADEPATTEQTRPSKEPVVEVPRGESLRVRPHPLDPDWLAPPDHFRAGNDLRYRYELGHDPYWAIPYYGYGYWPFGYGYGYGGYHHSFYRPSRPLYQHRSYDYTYRGIPDRRSYRGFGPRFLRSFNGPVPLHWYYGD